MPFPWMAALIIANIALTVVSLVLRPKPATAKPDAVRDLEAPTAEAGRPIIKVFGSPRITGLNVLDTVEKGTRTYEVKV